MPKNAEYLIFAFGIVSVVVAAYFLRTVIKLKSIRHKLSELSNHKDA